ncbi:hypothetical protein PR048_031381 [Dryococelus australis]|uniref:Uncharacterized protein n=1 Tax=Dryococelus australis TaxID=614101 RepID=A0ABQ9G540_9NEOP|nr:hypothetical protein PR048_031381 [Dryococelus australis]
MASSFDCPQLVRYRSLMMAAATTAETSEKKSATWLKPRSLENEFNKIWLGPPTLRNCDSVKYDVIRCTNGTGIVPRARGSRPTHSGHARNQTGRRADAEDANRTMGRHISRPAVRSITLSCPCSPSHTHSEPNHRKKKKLRCHLLGNVTVQLACPRFALRNYPAGRVSTLPGITRVFETVIPCDGREKKTVECWNVELAPKWLSFRWRSSWLSRVSQVGDLHAVCRRRMTDDCLRGAELNRRSISSLLSEFICNGQPRGCDKPSARQELFSPCMKYKNRSLPSPLLFRPRSCVINTFLVRGGGGGSCEFRLVEGCTNHQPLCGREIACPYFTMLVQAVSQGIYYVHGNNFPQSYEGKGRTSHYKRPMLGSFFNARVDSWESQSLVCSEGDGETGGGRKDTRIGKFREFNALVARLHSTVYTRDSHVCSLAVNPHSSQCYNTPGSMALTIGFLCKSTTGSESSRACLMNCGPIEKATSAVTCRVVSSACRCVPTSQSGTIRVFAVGCPVRPRGRHAAPIRYVYLSSLPASISKTAVVRPVHSLPREGAVLRDRRPSAPAVPPRSQSPPSSRSCEASFAKKRNQPIACSSGKSHACKEKLPYDACISSAFSTAEWEDARKKKLFNMLIFTNAVMLSLWCNGRPWFAPTHQQVSRILVLRFRLPFVTPLVHTVFDTSWRRLAQSSPSTVTAGNQCAVDIGISVHETAESSVHVTELANFSATVERSPQSVKSGTDLLGNLRPTSRSEGTIRATLTRTPSASSLLRALRAINLPPYLRTFLLPFKGATVAEWLACSPPTKAIRVQSPAGSHRIFACGASCWTMPLVGGINLLLPPLFHSGAAPYSPQTPSSALKTSMLRADQISSLTHAAKETAWASFKNMTKEKLEVAHEWTIHRRRRNRVDVSTDASETCSAHSVRRAPSANLRIYPRTPGARPVTVCWNPHDVEGSFPKYQAAGRVDRTDPPPFCGLARPAQGAIRNERNGKERRGKRRADLNCPLQSPHENSFPIAITPLAATEDTSEKTRRPAGSSGTIPSCENAEAAPSGNRNPVGLGGSRVAYPLHHRGPTCGWGSRNKRPIHLSILQVLRIEINAVERFQS